MKIFHFYFQSQNNKDQYLISTSKKEYVINYFSTLDFDRILNTETVFNFRILFKLIFDKLLFIRILKYYLNYKVMGAEHKKISINESVQYVGQVNLTKQDILIPQGKGSIRTKNSYIQGIFDKGNLIKGKLTINSNNENIDSIQYEGNFQNGLISGQGKLKIHKAKSNQQIITTGIYENSILKKGKIQSINNYSISGIFSQNMKLQDYGTYHNIGSSIKMSGKFIDSNLSGIGKYQFSNGDFIQGNFQNGNPSEKFAYKSKQFSIESFTCNKNLDGVARITLTNKKIYEGELKNGKLDGEGKIIYPNGTILEGDFLLGSISGNCKIVYPADHDIQTYEGQMADNQPNGIGILTFKKGMIYKGYFYYGKKNGPGYLVFGTTKYRCFYSMDKLVGQPTKIL